jgi:hypothetical protein
VPGSLDLFPKAGCETQIFLDSPLQYRKIAPIPFQLQRLEKKGITSLANHHDYNYLENRVNPNHRQPTSVNVWWKTGFDFDQNMFSRGKFLAARGLLPIR